jgi:twitching motility protein PilT
MQTMDAALANLVRRGVITQAFAEERSSQPDELRRLVTGTATGAPNPNMYRAA